MPLIQAGMNAEIVVYMEASGCPFDPFCDPLCDPFCDPDALPKSDPNIPCDLGSSTVCPLCDCDPVCDSLCDPLCDSDPIMELLLDFDFDGEDMRVRDSRKLLKGDEGFCESRFIKYPDINLTPPSS